MKRIHPYDLYDICNKVPMDHSVARNGKTVGSYAELGATTTGDIIDIDGEPCEVTTLEAPSPTCSLQ